MINLMTGKRNIEKEREYEASDVINNFINFIKTELISYVAVNYRTNNARLLVALTIVH